MHLAYIEYLEVAFVPSLNVNVIDQKIFEQNKPTEVFCLLSIVLNILIITTTA